MNGYVEDIINSAVLKIIENTNNEKKIKKLIRTHNEKVHFIPKRYRVFGGLLQSMNIQFGNFIETLMQIIIERDDKYEIIYEYSGKKNNKFKLSEVNDGIIDSYITKCQYDSNININDEFTKLLSDIVNDDSYDTNTFKHDIDLLFRDKSTGIIYYVECKYNDDHDTGKFADTNRKFIKTYAYLSMELNIKNSSELVPILYFFTNKKMKGNIYLPENSNIERGVSFFNRFLSINYEDVGLYMKNLSENKDIIEMFDKLYDETINIGQDK